MGKIGKEMKKTMILVAACLVLVVLVWIFKYRENYNYLDSNATWHVLLTIQAYDETPFSVHKFLPIVSLGDELDKGIPWAEMVADAKGNYYYTSFSAAGFVLPYLFMKLFHLPATEGSLYLFNMVLCCLALLLTIKLFVDLFEKYIKKETIILATTGLFVFQTEILQGMGQVYWPQSIMQVLLPLQFLCFLHFEKSKKWKTGYFLLAVLMPYTEWTGFVANVGFALAFFFKQGMKITKTDFLRAFYTGLCTIGALLLYCGHYLSVVEWESVLGALRDRYYMRTTYSDVTTFQLIFGYWKSFQMLWIVLGILGIGCVILNKGVKWIKEYLYLFPIGFVMTFPVLENFVMKDHAVSYTYDRMKLIYPLLLAVFILLSAMREKKYCQRAILCGTMIAALINLYAYTQNTEYLWAAEYRTDNEILAEYCKEYYHADSLYGLENAAVRGYANLLFDRGMYENISKEELFAYAKERNVRYAVLVRAAGEPDPANVWNLYAFSNATVYDMETGDEIEISVIDGEIVKEGERK